MQTAMVVDMTRAIARKPAIPDADPAQVLTRAALRAAEILDVPQRTLADIIGVSPSTISRAANGGAPVDPATKAGELTRLWVRVFRSLDAIVGSNDAAARAWLNGANAAFGGARPIDRLRSAEGLIHVLHYLDTARGRP
ncbi:MAG TPA: antitoxin Xre/MbcA/ParS toxin-binding domain-containing protein [Rhodanobacteraceae bacterium]|nr:antitoxin Xre/MbcA/ParS toxin-binding domain-containing protein [Rhodanobacteraceae bacterium]